MDFEEGSGRAGATDHWTSDEAVVMDVASFPGRSRGSRGGKGSGTGSDSTMFDRVESRARRGRRKVGGSEEACH